MANCNLQSTLDTVHLFEIADPKGFPVAALGK